MTTIRPLRAAPLLALLLFAGAAGAADSPLAGTSQAWEDAVARGDAAAVGAIYAEDAEALPPNMPRQEGRKAITETMAGMIAQGLKIKLSVREEQVDGALGFKSGDYIVYDKDGKDIDHGKWVEVWQRKDGKWWLTRDIWNSDLPPPPPPAEGTEEPAPANGP